MRALLLPFVVVSSQLNAQTTFAPVGATWTYAAYPVQQWPNPVLFPVTVTAIGDTVISGTSCRILDVPDLPCYFIGLPPIDHVFTNTSNDSVYWYDEAGEIFRLLIPFNAQAGDDWTIPVADPVQPGLMLDTVSYHVDSVSQVVIDGMPLRTLFVTRSTTDFVFGLWVSDSGRIVERLGDVLYLIPWLAASCSDGFEATGLVCYEDTEISWLNPEYTQCDLGVGIAEPMVAAEFTVAPNPLDHGNTVRVNMTGQVLGNGRIDVMDATGRNITSVMIRSQITEVTMPCPGLFLMTILDGMGNFTSTRIIVN